MRLVDAWSVGVALEHRTVLVHLGDDLVTIPDVVDGPRNGSLSDSPTEAVVAEGGRRRYAASCHRLELPEVVPNIGVAHTGADAREHVAVAVVCHVVAVKRRQPIAGLDGSTEVRRIAGLVVRHRRELVRRSDRAVAGISVAVRIRARWGVRPCLLRPGLEPITRVIGERLELRTRATTLGNA